MQSTKYMNNLFAILEIEFHASWMYRQFIIYVMKLKVLGTLKTAFFNNFDITSSYYS